MNEFKGVIFDMDGLMFDTENLSSECWVRVGRENNFEITRELIDSTRGLDRRKTKILLEEKFGDTFDFQVFSDRSRQYMDDVIKKQGMPIKAGLLELLEYIRENGLKCAVASSTERERVEYYLETAGIRKYFNTIVCGDKVKRGKPNPDIFRKAAECLQTKCSETAVFEDAFHAAETAKKDGFPVVAVYDDHEKRQEEIRALADCFLEDFQHPDSFWKFASE